ncbi:MAG: ABC transporter permease, partial [Bryobacteraceae bacterium]
LPYCDPHRLVILERTDSGQTGHAFSARLLYAVRGLATSLEQIAGFQYESFNLAGGGEPDRLQGMLVTANLFATIGIEAQIGRTFQRGDELSDAPRVVVLSYGLWARKFASDPKMIGRTLRFGREQYRVVGVMPPSFHFDRGEGLPEPGFDFSPHTELWAPLQLPATDGRNYLITIARLRAGTGLRQAQAEMGIVTRRVEREMSDAPPALSLSLTRLDDLAVRDVSPPLLLLFGAVGLLLSLACANVANLMLLRAASRRMEFAIRASLGAGRWRLARQWMTECSLYALGGGGLGLLLAVAILRVTLRAYPGVLLRAHNTRLHWPVALFCLLLSLAAGIGFGLALLRATLRAQASAAVRQGRSGPGREGRALRQWLVGAEVALAFVLLAGAGLLVRSFLNLLAVDPGFHPDRVLTTQIDLPPAKYPDGAKMIAFFRSVVGQLRQQPQVDAAGLITILPMGGLDRDGPGFVISGRSGPDSAIPPAITMPLVSP